MDAAEKDVPVVQEDMWKQERIAQQRSNGMQSRLQSVVGRDAAGLIPAESALIVLHQQYQPIYFSMRTVFWCKASRVVHAGAAALQCDPDAPSRIGHTDVVWRVCVPALDH